MTDTAYVRSQFIAPAAPPVSDASVLGWMRQNLFASWRDTILTLLAAAVIIYFLPGMLDFLFFSAVWSGEDRSVCLTVAQGGQLPDDWKGACWAYVADRFTQFMVGSYPRDQLWRPILVVVLFVALLIPFLMPKAPRKGLNAILLLVALPIVSYVLLLGGNFGLSHVETPLWGGLMVTLILSFVGIVVSFPVGILLALGRRSKLPVLRTVCIAFIELIRGVPLITVLFMASVLLPLFLTPGNNIDKFLRALVGVSIFASAYMAEVIRGGLQAIPRGQYEAAASLGLGYWKRMGFIVLPQALKHVIPGIVNIFISLFKDTSLVSIVGIFDLLNTIQAGTSDTNWFSPTQATTGYIFAAIIYWIFCFSMSRYSLFMERRLNTGHKR